MRQTERPLVSEMRRTERPPVSGVQFVVSVGEDEVDKAIDGACDEQRRDAKGEKGGDQHGWHVAFLKLYLFYLPIVLI